MCTNTMVHTTDREKALILNVEEYMRLALERDNIGESWQGRYENGKPIKDRSELVSRICHVSRRTVQRMRERNGEEEV